MRRSRSRSPPPGGPGGPGGPDGPGGAEPAEEAKLYVGNLNFGRFVAPTQTPSSGWWQN